MPFASTIALSFALLIAGASTRAVWEWCMNTLLDWGKSELPITEIPSAPPALTEAAEPRSPSVEQVFNVVMNGTYSCTLEAGYLRKKVNASPG